MLSKFSHDDDLAVALNAIFAMGLAGAGTNNARLAQMLRQLAGYYYKEPDCLFMVHIAHGQRHHWDKPFFSDRNIMNRPTLAVDVVGQAGKPRTISGFQTHQTPVRWSA
ncbi:hypothetical protein M405DRAFT_830643 [Rhizopogon salebrosus TDB-379]|nr:hypothetical protein M405DRAFT_830643 [Rhizopogon salebrosus TDB-379]